MKYLDEYPDGHIVRALAARIHERVTRPWVLMEICGGQTHTIMRYGIDELLPKEVELVGAPMVSAEGACTGFYQYRRHSITAHAGEPI